jgi:hypothetical protein
MPTVTTGVYEVFNMTDTHNTDTEINTNTLCMSISIQTNTLNAEPTPLLPMTKSKPHHIIFPGGGIYFFWQAGNVKAMQETYDLKNGNFTMSGASAGSISSVLAACNVNMDNAMKVALRLSDQANIFTNGLSRIWGKLIEKWLQEILPENSHIICSGKVNISITTITASFHPLHRKVVNMFSSKQDVIDACLTSVHIPYFIDGNFFRTYRGDRCVDGSFLFFLHNTPWCESEQFDGNQRALMLYHRRDTELMKHHWGVLQTIDRNSLVEMFNLGYNYGIHHRLAIEGSNV